MAQATTIALIGPGVFALKPNIAGTMSHSIVLEHEGRPVFSFGVNDCVHEAEGRPRGSEDRFMPPILLDYRVERLSNRLATLCHEIRLAFLPVFSDLQGSAAWRQEAGQGDGVHPARHGYTTIYQAVLARHHWRDWVP